MSAVFLRYFPGIPLSNSFPGHDAGITPGEHPYIMDDYFSSVFPLRIFAATFFGTGSYFSKNME